MVRKIPPFLVSVRKFIYTNVKTSIDVLDFPILLSNNDKMVKKYIMK